MQSERTTYHSVENMIGDPDERCQFDFGVLADDGKVQQAHNMDAERTNMLSIVDVSHQNQCIAPVGVHRFTAHRNENWVTVLIKFTAAARSHIHIRDS